MVQVSFAIFYFLDKIRRVVGQGNVVLPWNQESFQEKAVSGGGRHHDDRIGGQSPFQRGGHVVSLHDNQVSMFQEIFERQMTLEGRFQYVFDPGIQPALHEIHQPHVDSLVLTPCPSHNQVPAGAIDNTLVVIVVVGRHEIKAPPPTLVGRGSAPNGGGLFGTKMILVVVGVHDARQVSIEIEWEYSNGSMNSFGDHIGARFSNQGCFLWHDGTITVTNQKAKICVFFW
mmetsp:Transcript_1273/g.1862  ORF Transcript_1273/g.1862 Transcript_1273/m.1862 type:complete len:229 (-) Transcript_1273:387-1073(-)